MQKWEYLFMVSDERGKVSTINNQRVRSGEKVSSLQFAEERGNMGWELITVTEDEAGRNSFYFKRPKG